MFAVSDHNYVYMSKCRQFQGLSTGMSILTIPIHTIKLQLHRLRHLIIHIKNIYKIKYLSVQLLIRGTCRVITGGKSKWLFFQYLNSLFFILFLSLKKGFFTKIQIT